MSHSNAPQSAMRRNGDRQLSQQNNCLAARGFAPSTVVLDKISSPLNMISCSVLPRSQLTLFNSFQASTDMSSLPPKPPKMQIPFILSPTSMPSKPPLHPHDASLPCSPSLTVSDRPFARQFEIIDTARRNLEEVRLLHLPDTLGGSGLGLAGYRSLEDWSRQYCSKVVEAGAVRRRCTARARWGCECACGLKGK